MRNWSLQTRKRNKGNTLWNSIFSFSLAYIPAERKEYRNSKIRDEYQFFTYPALKHGIGTYPTLKHGIGTYPALKHGIGTYPALKHGTGTYPALKNGLLQKILSRFGYKKDIFVLVICIMWCKTIWVHQW